MFSSCSKNSWNFRPLFFFTDTLLSYLTSQCPFQWSRKVPVRYRYRMDPSSAAIWFLYRFGTESEPCTVPALNPNPVLVRHWIRILYWSGNESESCIGPEMNPNPYWSRNDLLSCVGSAWIRILYWSGTESASCTGPALNQHPVLVRHWIRILYQSSTESESESWTGTVRVRHWIKILYWSGTES